MMSRRREKKEFYAQVYRLGEVFYLKLLTLQHVDSANADVKHVTFETCNFRNYSMSRNVFPLNGAAEPRNFEDFYYGAFILMFLIIIRFVSCLRFVSCFPCT